MLWDGWVRSRCEDATRAQRPHAAAVHDDGAVDDDVGDPRRIAVGIGEGRLVLDGAGIEDCEVGGVALAHEPAVAEAEPRGAHPRHLVDGRLEREELLLAGVLAEHTRERAVGTRMGLSRAAAAPLVERYRVE